MEKIDRLMTDDELAEFLTLSQPCQHCPSTHGIKTVEQVMDGKLYILLAIDLNQNLIPHELHVFPEDALQRWMKQRFNLR